MVWGELTLTFNSVRSVLKAASERSLGLQELPQIPACAQAKTLLREYDMLFSTCGDAPGIFMAMWRLNAGRVWRSAVLSFCRLVAMLLQIYCLWRIVRIAEINDNSSTAGRVSSSWEPALLAVGLALGTFLQSWAQHNLFHVLIVTATRARALLIALVYRQLGKAMASEAKRCGGRVLNHVATDAHTVVELIAMSLFFLSALVEMAAALAWMGAAVGYAVVPAAALIVLLFPVQVLLTQRLITTRREAAGWADRRVKAAGEFFGAISVIKALTWENTAVTDIGKLRRHEAAQLTQASIVRLTLLSFLLAIPGLLSVTTFAVEAFLRNSTGAMTPSRTFLIIALLQLLSRSFQMMPRAAAMSSAAAVSLRRIDEFCSWKWNSECCFVDTASLDVAAANGNVASDKPLNLSDSLEHKERAERCAEHEEHRTRNGTEVMRLLGTFGWDEGSAITADIHCASGTLTILFGAVGSGKSTLLHAMIGDGVARAVSLHLWKDAHDEPRRTVVYRRKGKVGFVAQEPWIPQGTVRESVLFGLQMNEQRYKDALYACALEEDIEQWGGDLTEVGENGVTLSGGQRQRLSLARACYADCELYVLDDPLSAVDGKLSRHIWNECIRGILRNRAVVMSTHNPLFLGDADAVYLCQDGTAAHLAPEDIAALQSDPALVAAYTEAAEPSRGGKKLHFDAVLGKGQRTSQDVERANFGRVSWRVYVAYVVAGGIAWGAAGGVLMLLAQALRSTGDWWYSVWTARQFGLSNPQYIGAAAALMVGATACAFIRAVVLAIFSVRAATTLHATMLRHVVFSPLSFFVTTPLGRVLNRFSKDIEICDDALPRAWFEFFQLSLLATGSLVLVIITVPFMALSLFVVVPVVIFVLRPFLSAARELMRLEGASRSPIVQLTQSTVDGLATLHALGADQWYTDRLVDSLDGTSATLIHADSVQRWAGMRVDAVTTLMVLVLALVVQYTSIEASLVGLALTQSMSLTGIMQFGMRLAAMTDSLMTSAESVEEYGRLESEECTSAGGDGEAARGSRGWNDGRVEFRGLTITYPTSPDCVVLQNILVSVEAGKHIGIVGRSGAGKSTILSSLLRLLPVPAGCVYVGGIDVTTIPLQVLRGAIGLIPQQPRLFDGSVRHNLDPFVELSDERLISFLTAMRCGELATSEGLQRNVGSHGAALSVGQRQLLCATRALLRAPRVLLMDEATASVDMSTERQLYDVVRACGRDVTILTVVHRVQTVMTYDEVWVVDGGQLTERGPPTELARQADSAFAQMLEAATRNRAELK